MRALVDTHALLWALAQPKKLPPKVRTILTEPEHTVYVSTATIWEICIKVGIKKLAADPQEIANESWAIGFQELPLHSRHALKLLKLKPHHRDPFDRMLVAQALEEGLTLLSQDPALARYGVPVLWE